MTEHYMQRYKYVLTDVLYGWELGKLEKNTEKSEEKIQMISKLLATETVD